MVTSKTLTERADIDGPSPDDLDGATPYVQEADLSGETLAGGDDAVPDVTGVDVDAIDCGYDTVAVTGDVVLDATPAAGGPLTAGPVASPAEVTTVLRALGFRVRSTSERTQAVRTFQGAYNLTAAGMKADGVVGPVTTAALRLSYARRKAGKPDASANFSFRAFACKCGGRFNTCRRIVVLRPLLRGLEAYRARIGKPVVIVSGYRCPGHNRAVGGASSSQHMFGAAADVGYAAKDTVVAALQQFSGIGRSRATRLVRHVDVRHVAGHNATGGTTTRPTCWDYSS